MGKCFNFVCKLQDKYYMFFEVVVLVQCYLQGILIFIDFCMGDGCLIVWLLLFGLECVYVGDIDMGCDVLIDLDLMRFVLMCLL